MASIHLRHYAMADKAQSFTAWKRADTVDELIQELIGAVWRSAYASAPVESQLQQCQGSLFHTPVGHSARVGNIGHFTNLWLGKKNALPPVPVDTIIRLNTRLEVWEKRYILGAEL